MEKGFGPGFLSGFPITNGYLNTDPDRRYHHAVEDSIPKNPPLIPNFGFQQWKASEENKSLNWFCHKPHFQQVAPASNEMFPLGQSNIGLQRSPTTGITPSRKRFLVFDQTDDKTTLLYSSMLHTPVQFGAYRVPNPVATDNSRPSQNDENIEDNSRDATEDEMHEDSEELDALLCSDGNTDSSFEDDEKSTGHSPSTVSDNVTPKLVEESDEEEDSFSVSTKRRKLSSGGDDAASNSCLKAFACSELESDADSSCGGRGNEHNEESYPMPGSKRSRREKIHQTVSILQSIIPDANEKDVIAVIDRAIHYLRSLKVKAKALGLDAI